MTEKRVVKTHALEFKLAALKQLEAGAQLRPLARELGVSRKLLHGWRKRNHARATRPRA